MYIRHSGYCHPQYSLLSPSHSCQPFIPSCLFALFSDRLIQIKAVCVTIGWEVAIMTDGLSIGYRTEDNACPFPQYSTISNSSGEENSFISPSLVQAQCRLPPLLWDCVSNGCVMPWRQHFTDFLPIFWLLRSFCSLFHHVSWALERWYKYLVQSSPCYPKNWYCPIGILPAQYVTPLPFFPSLGWLTEWGAVDRSSFECLTSGNMCISVFPGCPRVFPVFS